MVRLLFSLLFFIVFMLNSQAKEESVLDSIKTNKMYLVWNDDSSLRDSLWMEKIIPPYKESRYINECVEDGLVKHLLSVEKLPRYKKGEESQFMFLFNDPNFESNGTHTVAVVSFQGDESLDGLVDEIRYITLNAKFNLLTKSEFMPSYKGGYNAMRKYLNDKVNLPGDTGDPAVYAPVLLGFIVGKDGSVQDLKILESYNDTLDEEAYRLVQFMPKWQAGKRAGSPVAVYVVLQLIFKL